MELMQARQNVCSQRGRMSPWTKSPLGARTSGDNPQPGVEVWRTPAQSSPQHCGEPCAARLACVTPASDRLWATAPEPLLGRLVAGGGCGGLRGLEIGVLGSSASAAISSPSAASSPAIGSSAGGSRGVVRVGLRGVLGLLGGECRGELLLGGQLAALGDDHQPEVGVDVSEDRDRDRVAPDPLDRVRSRSCGGRCGSCGRPRACRRRWWR